MLDAIIVIAQYARDQAVVSAREQVSVSIASIAVWFTENTYYDLHPFRRLPIRRLSIGRLKLIFIFALLPARVPGAALQSSN